MRKEEKYVDGFVLPVPKKNLAAYKKLAKTAAKVWLEHGALDYVECMGDDVPKGKITSLPMSVKLKPNEIVFFSWATYKSKTHRNQVMKKVMADPRMQSGMENPPFDARRMCWGSFKTFVRV